MTDLTKAAQAALEELSQATAFATKRARDNNQATIAALRAALESQAAQGELVAKPLSEAIEDALAEIRRVCEADIEVLTYREYEAAHQQYRDACHPEAIRSLIERLRVAEADAVNSRERAELALSLCRDAQQLCSRAQDDAARYRWLRDEAPGEIQFDHTGNDGHCFQLIVPFDGLPINNDAESAARLDAAIDAMKETP